MIRGRLAALAFGVIGDSLDNTGGSKDTAEPAVPLHFRARHRLTHAREFEAVYGAKVRKTRGPLIVFTRPNGLANHRLGLAVSARLGGAVHRNRLKRLIREAFRHEQQGMAGCFDMVVSVRGSDVLPLAAYRRLLVELVTDCAAEWKRREPKP